MEEQSESTYKVPLTKIISIESHPNADSLEIATVYGFQVIVKKNVHKINDLMIYVPIDSILPKKLEEHLFPEGSKVKLNKSRIRQIRLRKIASQGMLISPEDIKSAYGFLPNLEEHDYSKELQITKYEPPAPKFQSEMGTPGGGKIKAMENSLFKKFNGLNNIKWFPTLFKEGELVVMQEKIHGSLFRAAKLPYAANTIWKKILKFLRLSPQFEFCFGSNNVQLQGRFGYKGFYGENIYAKMFKAVDMESKLKDGEIIFGEIYGSGIQKNYTYGCKEGEHKFILFDVKVLNPDLTQRWLNPDEVISYAKERGFEMVPEIYRGPFSMQKAKDLTIGDSVLAPSQKIREGVVVKAIEGYSQEDGGKKALKVISEAYLDGDQTDFH